MVSNRSGVGEERNLLRFCLSNNGSNVDVLRHLLSSGHNLSLASPSVLCLVKQRVSVYLSSPLGRFLLPICFDIIFQLICHVVFEIDSPTKLNGT